MLRTIAAGKKPDGATRRPTPTAAALAGYLLTITAATTLTLRQLAAEIDRDARSCRTAAEQIIAFGVEGLTWADADTLTFRPTTLGAADVRPAESVPVHPWDVPVESWEEEFTFDRPPVDVQYSLFGGLANPIRMEATAVTAAACSVRKAKETVIDDDSDANISPENPGVNGANPVKTRTEADSGFVLEEDVPDIDVGNKVCANLAQTLHKPCTDFVQKVQKSGHEGLAEAMARLGKTLDSLPSGAKSNISTRPPAQAPACTRVSKEIQEINLNQSTKVNQDQDALNQEFKLILAQPSKIPKFDAAERERRIVEIREKVPDAAEHVVGTLANMMAFGTMPESVFYGALTDASAPTVRNHGAFLNHKVQSLKKEYRWHG